MTINEMLKKLQALVDDGYGDYLVTTPELDEIGEIDLNPFKKGYATIWCND